MVPGNRYTYKITHSQRWWFIINPWGNLQCSNWERGGYRSPCSDCGGGTVNCNISNLWSGNILKHSTDGASSCIRGTVQASVILDQPSVTGIYKQIQCNWLSARVTETTWRRFLPVESWTTKEYSNVLAHLLTAIPAVLVSPTVSAIDPDLECDFELVADWNESLVNAVPSR